MRRKPSDERLYWRGRTLWCRVPNESGRIVRKTTKCTDEKAAAAFADGLERRYADPSYAAAASSTLEGSIKSYLADLVRRRRADATLSIARGKCGHFVRIWGRDMPMLHITSALVLEYMDQRRTEGAGDFTIKKELGHLSQVLRIAKFLKVYFEDVRDIIPPFLTGSPKRNTRAPSFAELRLLLAEFIDSRAAHLAFIAATGARLGESFRARREDVDFAKRLVRIRGTKTKLAAAWIPITALSEPLLRWSVDHAPGKDLLFRPWGKIWRDVTSACVRAGIEKVTANDLRRAFGSWHRAALMASGNSKESAAEITSKLLRHSTMELVQTTYADLDGAAVGSAIGGRLDSVSDLYALTAATAPTSDLLRDETLEKQAPPVVLETTTFGLGNRSQNVRSRGTKLGLLRSRVAASVPELYASDGQETAGNSEAAEPPRLPAWVHEATANLACLLAGVAS